MADSIPSVEEPFPIFKLAGKYMLYDVNVVTHVRANHNIPGVLIGGLPQAPQQNIFSGIPCELMPEEARLLCEKGAAYVVDDVAAHKQGLLGRGMSDEERKRFQESLRRQGQAAAGQVKERAQERRKEALERKVANGDWNDIPEDMLKPPSRPGSRPSSRAGNRKAKARPSPLVHSDSGTSTPTEAANQTNGIGVPPSLANGGGGAGPEDNETLFSSANGTHTKPNQATTRSRGSSNASQPQAHEAPAYAITPTISYPPLTTAPPPAEATPTTELPDVPPSYPLYRHLHEQSYFLMPGLRFGCQYMAYPGDPLRFHSHFLCNGMDWDQEFDLLDLVGGGRLGTGVKKGFLIGGQEESRDSADDDDGRVRAFCVEWGGM